MRIFLAFCVAVVLVAPPAAADIGIGNLFNTGCEVTATPARGCLITANVKGPGAPGALARGSKEGQACGYNILSLFAWGDVRIATAMKNGGITQISSADSKSFELVPGFYGFARYCTVVSGE